VKHAAGSGRNEALLRLASMVTRDLGIRMPESKLTLLGSRLLRRVQPAGFDSLEAYERYILSPQGKTELRHFYDVVTTNKTDFFREPKHFKYLTEQALPALAAAQTRSSWTCRVWCAGCSSGEEVYTLAIVLSEYERAHRGFSFAITASDISSQVLQRAVSATYPEALGDPIPLELRSRYLLRDKRKGLIRLVPELRSRVRFVRLNFMQKRYRLQGPFDVIFFRNVMIYFDKPTQEAVVQKQCKLLRPDGYFFISHSESLAGLRVPLQTVANSVFRKVS
jgi:chemotaxis protein methyltransferase CheR